MCKKCSPVENMAPVKNNLWTLAANKRCAVIGTCLEVTELKRVANRFKQWTKEHRLTTDYDFHSYFVSISGEKNVVSSYLNKLLNKRYQSQVRLGHRLKTEQDILDTWCKIDRNDLVSLSGYFWAFMTSKYTPGSASDRIYGDIHMISHIAGRSEKTSMQKLLHDNQRLQHEMRKKEQQLARKTQQIQEQYLQIEQLESQKNGLSRLLQQFKFQREFDQPRRDQYESRIYQQQQQIHRLEARLERMQLKKDMALLAVELRQTDAVPQPVATDSSCDKDCRNCRETDLCGKTILYVGGFSRHRKRFQQLTHSINGKFYYHDGGKQQSEHQLDELVKKSDCVFCPVDCISHNAMGRIKSLVKQECKDCVYLKSASISAFKNEVMRYAS